MPFSNTCFFSKTYNFEAHARAEDVCLIIRFLAKTTFYSTLQHNITIRI